MRAILGSPTVEHGEQKRRDLEIAARRVGSTPQQRIRWFVEEFLAEDPRELSTPEHIAREDQATMFVALSLSDAGSMLSEASIITGTGGTFGDEHLREVWLEVSDLLRRFEKGEPVQIPSTPTYARRRTDTGRDLRVQIVRTGEGRAAFVAAVFDLLSQDVRVRRCDECDKFFIPERRQERHPACARAFHDREWNEKRRTEKQDKKKGETNG